MLPGLFKVRQKRAGGRTTEYWYAWRGGPCILKVTAGSMEELQREVGRLSPAAVEAQKRERNPAPSKRFLAGLIVAYLDSAEYAGLADRTRADQRAALEIARDKLGTLEAKALESPRVRKYLLDWRDQWKTTPKTADARMAALARVITWAHDRGEIGVNPLVNWPRIYRVNRADMIWTPADMAVLLDNLTTQAARDAVLFAAHSGLRLGDLVALPWSAIGEHAIVWQTGKSRGRRTVIVPISPDLRAVLDRLPKGDATTVLLSSKGLPWTDEGLQTAVQRAKQAAKAKGITSIQKLRFHDLRGTAATNLVQAGLSPEDVATILGWSKSKVQDILARYVTAETVALAIVERMKRRG